MEANNGEWIVDVMEEDTVYSFVQYTDSIIINETVLRLYKPGVYTSVAIGAGELVIEKLGSLLNECGYLRCYEDSELGFYSTGIANDCEMIFTDIETPLLQNGTDGESQQKILSLHPNPNRGATLLQLTEGLVGEQIEVVIYDLQGKQWQIQRFEALKQSQWMATNDLPEGIYICVLKVNGEQKEQVKMVVLK